MPRRYYSSTAARTTLSSSCNNSDTTLSVTAVSGWPSSFPYTLIIDQDTINEEVVNVTARTGTTLTVERGQDGTTAVSHSAGASVNHGVSARDFNEPNQFLNEGGTVAGPTLVTANSASTALEVRQTGAGLALRVEDETNPDATPVVVDAAGDLGVGTATPDARLVVVESGSQAAVRITNTGTGNSLVVEDSANPDSTPFVIDASGNVGIGLTAPSGPLHVSSDSSLIARFANNSTDAVGAQLYFVKRRGSAASPTVVAQDDTLGRLEFFGWDGSTGRSGAAIISSVDATPGANDMPGRLTFLTTPDGSTTLTERMRITNAGNVGIGTTAPNSLLDVAGAAHGSPTMILYGGANATDRGGQLDFRINTNPTYASMAAIKGVLENQPASENQGGIAFQTRPTGAAGQSLTERMRITAAGNVGIGTGSPTASLDVASTSQAVVRTTSTATNSSLSIRRHNGTLASPTTVANGDSIGAIAANGYDGSAYVLASRIQFGAEGSISTSVVPGNIRFESASSAGVLTERMRIDSAGNVGIGTTPSFKLETYDASSNIAMVRGDSGTALFLRRGSADANGPDLNFNKARNTSGSPQSVSASDVLGNLVWRGHDGTQYVAGAAIIATVDGTPGANDMPGRLSFQTTADGSATLTERMRIDNAGLITGTGTSLGAWTAYTPTLGGTGWAIGNGAFSATYCQIGKCVIFKAQFTAGSTTTFGSDSPTITLPITSLGTARAAQTVTGWFLDASAGSIYQAAPFYNSTTTVSLRTLGASGLHTTTTATVPFAWDAATGDVIRVSGIYEIA